ncbi:MAG: sodium-dependent transporter, partial [Coxiellaceae bacterium]|nr:sodium-dependent transporter [Coxiellaceae bacterium]
TTDLATNILLPIGGLLFALFAGWVMSQQATKEELCLPKAWIYQSWLFSIRFIAPIAIVVILIAPLT